MATGAKVSFGLATAGVHPDYRGQQAFGPSAFPAPDGLDPDTTSGGIDHCKTPPAGSSSAVPRTTAAPCTCGSATWRPPIAMAAPLGNGPPCRRELAARPADT